MITAVDIDVLLDVLVPGAAEGDRSEERLAAGLREGALVICPTVAAELGAQFAHEAELKAFLRDTGLRIDPFGLAALHGAGQAWRSYRRRRPAPGPERVLGDFLVGAHALAQTDRLLTRNRDFYRTSFPKLKLGP